MANKLVTSAAKEHLFNLIMNKLDQEGFAFSLEDGKKLYCNVKEKNSAETIQLCVSMTAPKKPIELEEIRFDSPAENTFVEKKDFSPEEKEQAKALIEKFNL